MPVSTLEVASAQGERTQTQYLEDFRAFKSAYRLAKNAPDAHALLEEYAEMEQGPTLGREPEGSGGYLMGFEIEYDLPNQSSAIRARIGQDLFQAGLTYDGSASGYHSTRRRGCWANERDATVSGGELVSPVLRDSRDSWTALKRALTILQNHGGQAERANVGGHVNIDHTAFSFGAEQNSAVPHECYVRLAKMGLVFEDVMYRLGANTRRGKRYSPTSTNVKTGNYHRAMSGSSYAQPLGSVQSVLQSPLSYLTRSKWLNLSHANRAGLGRIEFRVFDGSMEWSVWYTRTLIASAFMRAAANPENDDILDLLDPMRFGSHRRADWRRDEDGHQLPTRTALRGEAWKKDTERFRVFLDMLFDTDREKNQVITLFAMTDWNYARARRN